MFPDHEPTILSILSAISRINSYTKGLSSPDEYLSSHMDFVASVMSYMSKAIDQLPKELKDEHSAIDWKRIKEFGDTTGQEKQRTTEEVVRFLRSDLPVLEDELQKILRTHH